MLPRLWSARLAGRPTVCRATVADPELGTGGRRDVRRRQPAKGNDTPKCWGGPRAAVISRSAAGGQVGDRGPGDRSAYPGRRRDWVTVMTGIVGASLTSSRAVPCEYLS